MLHRIVVLAVALASTFASAAQWKNSLKPTGEGAMTLVLVENGKAGYSISIGEILARIPEVLEVHHVAGEDCYLVKVRTANTEALGRLLREKIGSIDAVTSTRSTIVLETMKETTDVPVDEPTGE